MLIFISSSFLLQFLFFHNFTKKIQIANFFFELFFLFSSTVFLYYFNASHNIKDQYCFSVLRVMLTL